jgi:hypothetical protein
MPFSNAIRGFRENVRRPFPERQVKSAPGGLPKCSLGPQRNERHLIDQPPSIAQHPTTLTENSADRYPPAPAPSRAPSGPGRASPDKALHVVAAFAVHQQPEAVAAADQGERGFGGPEHHDAGRGGCCGAQAARMGFGLRPRGGGDDHRGEPSERRQHAIRCARRSRARKTPPARPRQRPASPGDAAERSGSGHGSCAPSARPGRSPATAADRSVRRRADRRSTGRDRHRPRRPASSAGNCAPWPPAACR